ncbi:hypothetical protein [Micromonospora inyonensis]|uniref:AAA domain-containing protein n=1 Tax=Micromonospora inyonensis TaxID=47866 RepID=A0A1C6SCC9_9ACTN|nr:hypothetical protein [Micromonospora inyonensis]SCL27145.1 hypothetical protein GA0074694_4725 [Micromonospora inyonensis]
MNVAEGESQKWTPPSPGEVLERVAAKCALPVETVQTALSEVGITLPSPVPPPRQIEVQRLRVEGTKSDGTDFSIDQRLTAGVWAIMYPDNFVGKTSILEFIVWALRGSPRQLAPNIKKWVRRITVDAVVTGQAVRLVLDHDASQNPSALRCRILSARSAAELADAQDADLRPLAEAGEAAQVEGLISTFMMEALGLTYTRIWNPAGGLDGHGAAQLHGWPVYFGACYLNPGGSKMLLGDYPSLSWLPGKLLELFIGLPYASVLAQLSTVSRRFVKQTSQAAHRAEQDRAARRTDHERWQRELADVREELQKARQSTGPLAAEAIAMVDATLDALRTARQAYADAADADQRAERAGLLAQQQVIDARETWQARRVLGLLSPNCCPRCEEPIDGDRHVIERQEASCAVCTRPLPEVNAELAQARIAELERELAAQQDLHRQISDRLRMLKKELDQAQTDHDVARARLDGIRAASAYQALRELELRAARLEGQLQVSETTAGASEPESDRTATILSVTHKVLTKVVTDAGSHLFPNLNQQIVALARDFGVRDLESVDFKRNGNLNATKDGAKTPFDDEGFPPGERLRVRIAVVIAMLRVSMQRGVPAHPGLLLIDAVGSEEVVTPDATRLVAELEKLTQQVPGLQVILTTAKPEYVEGVLPPERIITSSGPFMF